jgi:hypothetical protein
VAAKTPSGVFDQASRRSVRIVVAPSRRRQNAAKSCSPTSSRDADCIRRSASGRGCHTVSARRSGSPPYAASLTR